MNTKIFPFIVLKIIVLFFFAFFILSSCDENANSIVLSQGEDEVSSTINQYEPNDSPLEATTLSSINTRYYAGINPSGDVDYYKINLTYNTCVPMWMGCGSLTCTLGVCGGGGCAFNECSMDIQYFIDLSPPLGANFDICIYDPAFPTVSLACSTNSGDSAESISFSPATDGFGSGVYLIEVIGYNGDYNSNESYVLHIW